MMIDIIAYLNSLIFSTPTATQGKKKVKLIVVRTYDLVPTVSA